MPNGSPFAFIPTMLSSGPWSDSILRDGILGHLERFLELRRWTKEEALATAKELMRYAWEMMPPEPIPIGAEPTALSVALSAAAGGSVDAYWYHVASHDLSEGEALSGWLNAWADAEASKAQRKDRPVESESDAIERYSKEIMRILTSPVATRSVHASQERG